MTLTSSSTGQAGQGVPTLPRPAEPLRAQHVDHGSIWVLKLSGEADLATMATLRAELANAARMRREHLVLDLTLLRFCDVGSAGLILAMGRKLPVSLAGARGTVKRVFELLDPWEVVPRYRWMQSPPLRR